MRLFDTLSGRREGFSSEGDVLLYVCGVTPYDTTHVGHARTYLIFDVLIRQLRHRGMRVKYIQNITDVDDSIVARADELGEGYGELGDRYVGIYMDDIAALGMLPASEYPRATEALPEMQELIRRLLATGHAYREGNNVYFQISMADGYGRLSRLTRAEMIAIEAKQDGSTVHDEHKRDPLDLLLWRGVPEGDPAWDSPWGRGRPGWHLECSALALGRLGKQIDIHGGGDDLVFPHHEAEIAQSEAVTGVRPFARFWVHVAMARLEGAKMSKSQGNMVFVRELLDRYSPDSLRLYLLDRHYRQPLDFDEEALQASARLASRLATAAHHRARRTEVRQVDAGSAEAAFDAALDDDLDTPLAIAALGDLASAIDSQEGGASYGTQRIFRSLAARLGLDLED